MATSTVDTVIPAPRDVVFKLFSERDSLNGKLPIQVSLKKPGIGSPSGIGAQYVLGVRGIGVTEETTELVPGERMVYRVIAGAPVKHHTGTIVFSDAPGGTRIVYTMESQPSLPVPAKVLEIGLRSLTNVLIGGVRKAVK
ncbi:SRPBCC family protein [Nocardia sp. NPDC051030]|uniref:SRPBCC family protein n=1 Tax=Nocardia sp. NPDC051030 TaxID=3155162 RepID=UPI0034409514